MLIKVYNVNEIDMQCLTMYFALFELFFCTIAKIATVTDVWENVLCQTQVKGKHSSYVENHDNNQGCVLKGASRSEGRAVIIFEKRCYEN